MVAGEENEVVRLRMEIRALKRENDELKQTIRHSNDKVEADRQSLKRAYDLISTCELKSYASRKKIIKATIISKSFHLTEELLCKAMTHIPYIFEDPLWFEWITHVYCRGHFDGCPIHILDFIFHDLVEMYRYKNPYGYDGSPKESICYFSLAKWKRCIDRGRLLTLLRIIFDKEKTLFSIRNWENLLHGLKLAIANKTGSIHRILMIMQFIATVDEKKIKVLDWRRQIVRVATETSIKEGRKRVITAVLWQGQRWGIAIDKPDMISAHAWCKGRERFLRDIVNLLCHASPCNILPFDLMYHVASFV